MVYGKYTGALPDGRAAFTPFAPRCQPPATAQSRTACWASLNSVAKLPYHWALDGISNTQTINPDALGHSEGERVENLVQVMDGYFDQGAHHLNVNVFGVESCWMPWSTQRRRSTPTSPSVSPATRSSSST